MTDIDKLKALALAATPGEWKVERLQGGGHHNVGIRVRGPIVSGFAAALNTRWANEAQAAEQEANAAYIAAACPATVLELIAERDELRAEVERLRAENGGLLSMAKTAETRMDASSEGGHLCAAPAAGTEKDATYDVLKSIIEDGYLSDTNTARGHAAIEAHSKAGKD